MASSAAKSSALDSARYKVYLRALPLLFVCYIIAYVDRNNVSVAKLTMTKSLPAFTEEIIGFGAGVFFLGYFLLEIPGTLIVERWSASKWICRIMITWGIIAAMTAYVSEPEHFYIIRFCLGLAEAGFFPGVIVYLTHWFPKRDRARALSLFLVASPIAMIVGNYISHLMLDIGEDGNPTFMGLKGWQCIFIFWGIPAVIMGIIVVIYLTDRPRHAKWLTEEERNALEEVLEQEKAERQHVKHLSVWQGLTNPNVLMLAIAYFGVVTGNYGVEIFLPSILEDWYGLGASKVTLLAMIPSFFVILGQLFIGWSSDHFQERRWHAIAPIIFGAFGLIFATLTQGNLVLTIICFTIASTGMKAYMPAFWSLPNMFLTAAAAAGSIGLINSIGNLGGFLGPSTVGYIKTLTGSYDIGIYFLATTCLISASVVFFMPRIHARLSSMKSAGARLQAVGVVAIVVAVVGFTLNYWIKEQIKPWGLSNGAMVSSTAQGPEYFNQAAGALDDWFQKQPTIRDALKYRLTDLSTDIDGLVDKPPAQLAEAERAKFVEVLKGYSQRVKDLKTELTTKNTAEDKRYILTVLDGLSKANQLVKDFQAELRSLGGANSETKTKE